MFAFNENKIYGAKMKQKLDEKAKGLTPVRNGKVAGAIPAESIFKPREKSRVRSPPSPRKLHAHTAVCNSSRGVTMQLAPCAIISSNSHP